MLEAGSGHLAGGPGAAEQLVRAAESLNCSGGTASDILTMMQNAQRKNGGRNNHMAADAATGNLVPTEELLKRYKEAKQFTSGTVFGSGNGELGTAARDKVIRRNRLSKEKESAATKKKNQKLRKLYAEVKKIQAEMKKKGFKWTNPKLMRMCRWKRRPKDKKMPTRKDELLARWQETKGRPSPQVSPANSDDEGKSDDDDDGDEASVGRDKSEDKEASVDGDESEDDGASLDGDESEDEEASLDGESGNEEEDGPSRGLEFGSNNDESSESEEEEYSDDE